MYKYPYGDSQQLNLDWVLTKLKELEASGGSGGADLEEVSNALISLTYNTSTAYRRYDYAFRNGKLYRCLSDTSGSFDPAAWQEALIGDDLAVLTRWINAIDAAAVVDVKFDTSGTNGKIQQKYHNQYHDVVEVDYTPVQNSKRPLSSNAGYELNGAITSMNHSITSWDVKTNGKIIFLGNSYGKNYANYPTMAKWPERTAEYLGLESHPLPTSDDPIAVDPSWNWFNVCRRSYSLYGTDGTSYAFITYLQQWVSNNPNIDYNSIGAVVLVAGINDARSGRASRVLSCLNNLATYIRQQMPNAVLYNGYCGWLDESRKASSDTHGGQLYQQSVAHDYMAGKQYGWNYLSGIENVFHDKGDMADYIHPNENGSKVIGLAVANALSTGGCSTVKTYTTALVQGLDGANGRTKILESIGTTKSEINYTATVNNGSIRQWLQDNVIRSQWTSLEFNISPALPMVYNRSYTLGTLDTPYSNLVDFGNQMLMCTTDTESKPIIGIVCRVYLEPRTDASGLTDVIFQVKGYTDGSESKNVTQMRRFVADSYKPTLSD